MRPRSLPVLEVIVVEKLSYKYMLKGRDISTNRRFECSCLLQGNILYVIQEADSHSVLLELSKLFFDGTVALHFANFLHMVKTMSESGSTLEQIEFFIVNNQKVSCLNRNLFGPSLHRLWRRKYLVPQQFNSNLRKNPVASSSVRGTQESFQATHRIILKQPLILGPLT